MNPTELNALLLEAAEELRQAHAELEKRVHEAANADADWRYKRAVAYAETEEGTVAARDAYVESQTANQRYAAKLAEDLRVSALEAVRSKRAILTASQTLVNLSREEMSFARTGPE